MFHFRCITVGIFHICNGETSSSFFLLNFNNCLQLFLLKMDKNKWGQLRPVEQEDGNGSLAKFLEEQAR